MGESSAAARGKTPNLASWLDFSASPPLCLAFLSPSTFLLISSGAALALRCLNRLWMRDSTAFVLRVVNSDGVIN